MKIFHTISSMEINSGSKIATCDNFVVFIIHRYGISKHLSSIRYKYK
jgi:hypothetical protein